MKILVYRLFSFFCLGSLLSSLLFLPGERSHFAYIDPALSIDTGGEVLILVSAVDLDLAARTITRLGGEVNNRLWLINSLSATLPSPQLLALAQTPGINTIYADRAVHSSGWDGPSGYVTERRKLMNYYSLDGNQSTLAAYLPDGGIISIAENGKLLIINADGSERIRTQLPTCPYKINPVIAPDGNVYVACEEKYLLALDSAGGILWRYTNPAGKFFVEPALGSDTLYLADEKRNLIALDRYTGVEEWRFLLATDGAVVSSPVIGEGEAIFVIVKNDPSKIFALSPSGTLLWSFTADKGKPLPYSPLYSSSTGRLALASNEKIVYVLNAADGSRLFSFAPLNKIVAQPEFATDGSLFIPVENGSLYTLNPDGSQRYEFHRLNSQIKLSPQLSQDENSFYVVINDKLLYAVDAQTGAEQWHHQMSGMIKSTPNLDSFGNLIFGSDANELVILNPDGQIVTRLKLNDKVIQPVINQSNGSAIVRIGDHTLVTLALMPSSWEGGADIEPTEIKREWVLSNPIPIDVGADQLHDQGITGQGVTIALLDSGVYFNKHVEDILGTDLDRQFLGQVDFVGNGTCTSAGQQHAGYCWNDQHNSRDLYGHGSHVAGIIWSQIIDEGTQTRMGVAPDANILSVRVLDNSGVGTYSDVIEGIQYVVANKSTYNIRVLNLSISAIPTMPYFADPLDRAVEQAWASGIVVIAAAGNLGANAETITVPGNDPYIITIGAVNDRRTPGFWPDDTIPVWSSTGPTLDGFIKPDIIAPGSNIVSFMYTEKTDAHSAELARNHPNYSHSISLFRMSGTSMATSVTSSVAALMLQAHPELTPDQVKYRLKNSAVQNLSENGEHIFNIFQQGNGRIWAPAAVLGDFPVDAYDNLGMDIGSDLAHAPNDFAFHYQGPVKKTISDDGESFLYYIEKEDGSFLGMGTSKVSDLTWLDSSTIDPMQPTWSGGNYTWGGGNYTWGGGNYTWGGGNYTWGGGNYTWGGGNYTWGGGNYTWGGGNYTWGGGNYTWGGGNVNPVMTTQWVTDD